MIKPWVAILFLLSSVSFCSAQGTGIGEWRFHIPFQQGIAIADAGNRVYCASELGMYYFNKADKSVNRFSRVQGLSDIGITDVAYCSSLDIIIVSYSNGNIDLLDGDRVVNMEDIKRASFPGQKRINKITVENKLAYLSCGFGVVIINLEKSEVKETYSLNINGDLEVNDVAINDGYIYAATGDGLFFAQENNANLNDPDEWLLESSLPDSSFSRLFVFEGAIYANYNSNIYNSDTLYFQENGIWQKVTALFGQTNKYFQAREGKVVVSHTYAVTVYDENWESIQEFNSYGYIPPLAAQVVFDENNGRTIWIADERKGLVEIIGESLFEAHTVSGPPSNRAHEITTSGSEVWVASGSVQGSLWQNTYSRLGVYKFFDDEWVGYNKSSLEGIDTLFDYLSVAVDPLDQDKVFFAAHGNGIVEMIDEQHNQTFGQSNSSLSLSEASSATRQYTGLTSLSFDSNNILWAANYGASEVLCAKDQEDNWYSFNLSEATNSRITGRMVSTSDNNIWVAFPSNDGIAVLNYNNTISDSLDDQVVGLTTGNGALPSNSVYAIAEDLDGEVWVGTAEGAVVFRSPTDLFGDNPSDAEQTLIQQDGYTEQLLASQSVTAIAIDGANRKWMGTSSSGVYLIGEEGTEEILHFTVENSPLMSNVIQTIGINQETGEVFFGTEQGVCSYKYSATIGRDDFSTIYAYPNPVEPNYYGDIAIKGLVANSEIRITEINGGLVYRGFSEGGQAVWNGKTIEGNRVKTGVYIVFCVAPDGSQSIATKILFIN